MNIQLLFDSVNQMQLVQVSYLNGGVIHMVTSCFIYYRFIYCSFVYCCFVYSKNFTMNPLQSQSLHSQNPIPHSPTKKNKLLNHPQEIPILNRPPPPILVAYLCTCACDYLCRLMYFLHLIQLSNQWNPYMKRGLRVTKSESNLSTFRLNARVVIRVKV